MINSVFGLQYISFPPYNIKGIHMTGVSALDSMLAIDHGCTNRAYQSTQIDITNLDPGVAKTESPTNLE